MNERAMMFRHVLATVAYRGGNVLRNAPADFESTRVHQDTRSAIEILSHINEVLRFCLARIDENRQAACECDEDWGEQVRCFYELLRAIDSAATIEDASAPMERLIAGPLADSLTHIGQLATLRKLAGSPVLAENYYAAEIEVGRVGPDQGPPIPLHPSP
ncbi:MAG: hypothetical protein ACF8GE_12125 [Phycisphaerales bacterium JB043]